MRTSRASGFTLLEVVAAFALFLVAMTFVTWAMSDCVGQSLAAERARQLRMLAELKLGEIAIFERHHDEPLGPEAFRDLPDELLEVYRDWEWQTDVTDKTVFGPVKDENAPGLFESGDTEEEEGTKTEESAAAAAKKGDQVILRQIVLTITAPGDDGGRGDSIEVVTYLPQVPAKSAATPKAGAPK